MGERIQMSSMTEMRCEHDVAVRVHVILQVWFRMKPNGSDVGDSATRDEYGAMT